MEAGGGLDVGHVFARLDAKLDDSNFKRFDSAVDHSRAKARDMSRDQDKLSRSTQVLSREQARHAQVLRSQGHDWASVSREVGVSEEALRSYNTTTRTTIRENEKVRRSTRDTSREFTGLEGGIARVNRVTTFFGRTLKLLKWPALISGAATALQGIDALAAGVVGLTSALAPLSGLLIAVPAALGTLGQGLGTALLGLMGVKEAVKALNAEQVKSGATATDMAKKHRTAASQIRSAEEQLNQTQRTEKLSQRELNEARRDAVKTLQDMRNAAIDASLGEKSAQLALRRSIADLYKAEANPKTTMLELEELELGVTEARQRVKEARLERKRADQEERKSKRGGVAGNPEVIAAQRQLKENEHDIVKAKREVIEAERDGRESLQETGSAAEKVSQTMSQLGPEAQRFARFLFGLKPTLQGLQETAAKGFLPGAETGIRAAMKNLPVVNRIIEGTGNVLGKMAAKAGRFFGSKGFGHDLEIIGKGNARTLGQMSNAGEHVFKALTKIMVVGQPLIRWLGKYLNQTAAWVEHATEVNRKNGDLAKFFGKTRKVVEVLTSIFGNLGGTLHVIGEEAAPLGEEILKAFDVGSEGLEKWAKSTKGRNSIAQYFKDAKAPLFEAGRLVRDIVKEFLAMNTGKGAKSLTGLLHQLRTELLPILAEVLQSTNESFGPALISSLASILGLFARLAGASGPLTIYVEAMGEAANITNFFLDAVPGLKGATVNLIGLIGVLKTFALLGKFTGVTKGLEMAFGEDVFARIGASAKGRLTSMVKSIFVRGALAGNLILSWGEGLASTAAQGISKQIGRFRSVARKAAIAFIGVFAPEVAAGMAAGGRLGEVLSAKFPKVAAMFRGGGKLAGRAFLVGILLAAALIGYELGKAINKQWPELGPSMRRFGIRAGEWLVNGLIDAVNLGIEGLNAVLNKANVLGKLGVHAPQIGTVGHVNWHSESERTTRRHEKQRKEGVGSTEVEPGVRTLPGQTPQELREQQREFKEGRRRRRRRRSGPAGPAGPTESDNAAFAPDEEDHPNRRHGKGKKPEKEAEETRKKVTGEHHKMRHDVEDESRQMEENVLSRFGKIRKGATGESQKMDKAVAGSVGDMQGAHDRATRGMLSATDNRFAGMREIVSTRSGAMASTLGDNVGQMNRTTSEGMGRIQAAVVKALKAFGVKHIDLGLKGDGQGDGGGKPGAKKAAGGGVFTVPGTGLHDTVYLPGVNAMVAPGEDLFAANRHQRPMLDYAVAATFGTPDLDSFFATYNRPHYLAKGGPIKRIPGVVLPAATSPIVPLERRLSELGFTITSGRDGGHAQNSFHYQDGGEALDYGNSANNLPRLESVLWPLRSKFAELFMPQSVPHGGLYHYGDAFSDPGLQAEHEDHIHVAVASSIDKLGALVGAGGVKRLKNLTVTGRPGTERTLAQLALNRVTRGANAFIDRKAGRGKGLGGIGGLSVPTGPIEKMARQVVSRVWGPGEFAAFNALEMQEAGWNPQAVNPESGAAGLAQALPPSKYPPGAWPYRGLRSAKLQLEWMVNYIRERYGSPAGAWAHEQSAGWYARGGRMSERFGVPWPWRHKHHHRHHGSEQATAPVGSPEWIKEVDEGKHAARGGFLRRFTKGGGIKGIWAGTSIDKTYPQTDGIHGYGLPKYVIEALAEWAGMPGVTMRQITEGESSGEPGMDISDPPGRGRGLYAINSVTSGDHHSSGYLRNPILNTIVAAGLASAAGGPNPNIWHGSSHVTGWNLHYKGDPSAIARHLGGKSAGGQGGGPTMGLGGGRDASRPPYGIGSRQRPHGKRARRAAGLEGAMFGAPPTGKYSPAALLSIAAQTGIALPFALLTKAGVPNWRGLSVKRYANLVNAYLRKIGEWRTNLGEERKAAEESFPANALLSSVTALSQNTINQATGYHPPIGGEVGAYGTGYSALAGFDAKSEAVRQQLLNTYTEGFLAPVERRESRITATRDRILASAKREGKDARAFAKAKLKGLSNRVKKRQAEAMEGKKLSKAAAAKLKARIRRQETRSTQTDIRHHSRVVQRRSAKRVKGAEKRHEEALEHLMDPVTKDREELEKRYQYETSRREQLAPLLSEIAANVQRTALVGNAQAGIFSAPSFARGGRIPRSAIPAMAGGGMIGGHPHVTVPLAVRLSGALEALNPQIQAIVDGRIHDLGQATGDRRMVVSAPGRRVSYGGK